MAGDERLVDLASAAAEGSAVDWKAAEQTAKDGSERAVVRELQVLAKIADMARAPDATPPISTAKPGEPLRIGDLWGHLRISEVIGEGSFGTVYRAWDRRLECEVALKLIKSSGVSPAMDLARSLREARLLARVRHRNVVRVFGADSHDGRFGLWMELVPGRSLEQVLVVHGEMGASEAAPIGVGLCDALAAVHRAGLLHRDLKTRNVMREDGGRIVLMDFGTGRDTSRMDASDDMAGTPLYLAPELFSGAKPSIATDIYSLGVLLYHLVTGDYPVRGTIRADVENAHRTGNRRPLRDVRPDLPSPFIEVIERALALNPSERYQSAGQFGSALAAAAGLPRQLDQPISRFNRKWPIAAAAGAVAAGILIALLTFWRGAPANSYDITASFYASRDGRDVRLSQGSRVRPGDEIYAVIDSSQPVWVYVINRDDVGQSFLLFPLPELSQGNPLPRRQKIRLPGQMGGERHNWQVTTVGKREHFILYATRQKWVELEQVLHALPRAELGRSVSALPLPMDAIGVLRGVGGLSPAASSASSSPGTELADVLPLGDDSESAEGVWARQISFQNPPE